MAVVKREAKMSPDENFEQTKIFDLTQTIWRLDSARRTASHSDKVTLLILAIVPRSLWPALIPNVGVGLREHTHTHYTDKLDEGEAQEHTTQNVLLICKVQR